MSQSTEPSAHFVARAPSAEPPETALLPVRKWFFALRERWFTAFLLAALVCGAIGWLLMRVPAVYSATATLLIERSNDRVVDIKQVVDNSVDSSLGDALLLTHIQQIRSQTFLSRAVMSFSPEERRALLAPYPVKTPVTETSGALASAVEESRIVDLVSKNLRADRTPRTLLITLTLRHRDPAMAQLLANRLADQYIRYLIDRSAASNDSALVFLRKEAEELKHKVEESEHDVQAYREANNLIFLEQNQNIVVERVRALSSALTQARVERLALDARLAQVEAVLKNQEVPRELISAPEFAGFAAVQRQWDDMRAKRDVLAQRFGPLHPLMQENATSLETLATQRHDQLVSALRDLRNQREKAVTQETQLASELATAERDSLRLDQLTVGYNVLQRSVATTRETYGQILSRLNETTISSRLQNTNIKFYDPASLATRPIEPNPLNILCVLIAVGAVVLVGYPLAADAMDRRVRTSADVENYLGSELAAILPAVKKVPEADRAWIVARGLNEEVAEAFRSLYSHVQFTSPGNGARAILVTSTIPGEGKSFVSANLATSFAAHGHRTLLVDADFRRPTLHRSFDLKNDAGLLPWLQKANPSTPVSIRDPLLGITELVPGLSLLRSGGISRQVTELLGKPEMSTLMNALGAEFNVVIIDASPAGVFPDADACVKFASELLYVCRFKAAERGHVRQTLLRLRQRHIRFLGIALNAVTAAANNEYYLAGRAHGRRYYREYHKQTA